MDFEGLNIKVPQGVYEPAEDTFFLEEAIGKVGARVLDMGTGSGYIALKLAKEAKQVMGADINPIAVEAAKENAKRNNISNAEFIVSDLFDSIDERFDTITFNTPYVEIDESGEHALAWSAGPHDSRVVDRFIDGLKDVMRPKANAFMIVSGGNGPDALVERLFEMGFRANIDANKNLFFESLHIIEASL